MHHCDLGLLVRSRPKPDLPAAISQRPLADREWRQHLLAARLGPGASTERLLEHEYDTTSGH